MGVCVLVAQSCPILCDPMDCSPPASSVHGIFQARILEWVPPAGTLPNSDIKPKLAGRFSTTEPPRKPPLVQNIISNE